MTSSEWTISNFLTENYIPPFLTGRPSGNELFLHFFQRRKVDEEWASGWALRVSEYLLKVHEQGDASLALEQLRGDLDRQLGAYGVRSYTAACAFFVLDLLEEINAEGAAAKPMFIFLSNMLQGAAVNDAGWRWIKSQKSLPDGFPKPTLGQMPEVVTAALLQYGFLGVLRRVYCRVRNMRQKIKPLQEACIREAASYRDWLSALARLDAALLERNLVPVITVNVDERLTPIQQQEIPEIEGPRTIVLNGLAWHPIAEQIMTIEERESARVEEAFFEEQGAHFLAALGVGCFTEDFHRQVQRAVLSCPSDTTVRVQAGEDISVMRSHYEVPPYLAKELRRALSSS